MNEAHQHRPSQENPASDEQLAAPIGFEGCFGWFHAAPGRRGVVLCSPNGYEELCCHRQWSRLAAGLAAAGLPTIRFDYPACGNSADEHPVAGDVEAWLGGIRDAIAFLRAIPGIEEVALVGLRLGATLAAVMARELAQDRQGIDILVLMAPCLSGAAYVKELRMLSMMAKARRPTEVSGGHGIEAAGFHYTTATIAGLKALDPRAGSVCPAKRVLILDRADSSAGAQLAECFRAAGSEVEEYPFPDYAPLMNDAALSEYPAATFRRAIDRLRAGAPRGDRMPVMIPVMIPAMIPAAIPENPIPIQGGVETAHWIPGGAPICGVFSEPAAPSAHRPALLILNTGANHHIGTNRMSVLIARRLVREGVAVLRIDSGGVGDSPSVANRPDNAFARHDMVADARRAVDWLAERGYRDITVNGLCSGAWLSYHAALADPRITGQILLNLQGLWQVPSLARTMESNRGYLRLLRSPNTWRRLVRGQIQVRGIAVVLALRLKEALAVRMRRALGRVVGVETIQGRTESQLRTLAARGVHSAFVYVRADRGLDELELHFGHWGQDLREQPNVHFTVIDEGDHLFSMKHSRDRVIEIVAARFSGGRFDPRLAAAEGFQPQPSKTTTREPAFSRAIANDQ